MNSKTENRLENPDTPYIFLDIDGVLATTHQYRTNRKKWHETYNCYRFDEKCVRVFNQITEKVNPVIILSSDWGKQYSLSAMNDIFEWNGVNAIVTDITSDLWGVKFTSVAQLDDCRADEILKYVHEHNIENWVAVDDLDLSPWIDENHFVRTPRANEGIKQSGVKDKILNNLKSVSK
mgnify:CR=1 FL=1